MYMSVEQAPGVGDRQEVWHAAVHGAIRVGDDWVTELKFSEMLPLSLS